MDPLPPGRTAQQLQQDKDHHDNRRVRELYRYFKPEQALAPPPNSSSYFDSWVSNNAIWTDEVPVPALSTASVSTPDPTVSSPVSTPATSTEGLMLGNPNHTLNSFAQLAALRLNVQRVLISVSDRESQFIMAESTPTANLDSNVPVHQGELGNDSLWAGCSTIDHTWSMCKNELAKATVALPPSTRQPPQYRFLVVNDLSKDDRYKSLPFVQGDPNFRFYAGTPLTTETNINIGCFFALDTSPREGLTGAEKETMGFLGTLIMDYLKTSRQAHEGRRATRLSRGLSCFVEGGSRFADCTNSSYMETPDFSTVSSNANFGNNNNNNNKNSLSLGSDSGDVPSRRSRSSDAESFSSGSSKADHGSSSGSLLPEFWSNAKPKGPPADETRDTTAPFKRAANLLRESLELGGEGGVIFVEAGNNPGLDSESGSDSAGETGNPATVLAVSTEEEPFAPQPGSKSRYPATNLDRGFLLRLFRRYSKGRLWGFHRDGMLSSSEDDEADEPQLDRPGPQKAADLPKGGKGRRKALENKLLNLYFPTACQVLFVPLWNATNSQWFAGCFCWNTVETRVFSPTVELSSVLGFGSSIMAEYSRIQSLISDRQKGDFIGSISHELRSPLHGILAATEFLQGTQMDEFQGSLLDTVNACGRTLLDTMNQVLDFSKIVSVERTWRNIKRYKASPMEVRNMERVHLDSYVATDLAVLAEEVVEGVCLGHAYGERATASADYPVLLPHTTARSRQGEKTDPNKRTEVEVVMDIAHNDWVYRTQRGALRRILMNILGNAMKYTDFGRVSIRLEATEGSEGRSRQGPEDLVTLTVSDTGKGISEEFMRGRLYTPFAQEDSLAVGTGLGLSIVRSLVKALNGSINTSSRPGEGTTVKVTLPLERPQDNENAPTSEQSSEPDNDAKDTLCQARLLQENLSGRRVAILGIDPVTAAQHPLWSIITRYLTEWYGLELVSWSPEAITPVDLMLADEQMLLDPSEEKSITSTLRIPALLVLCNRSVDYGTARTKWSHLANTVEMIRQPSGPHKLARSIRRALENVSTAAPIPIDLPERPKSEGAMFSTTEVCTRGDWIPGVNHIDLSGVSVELTPELTSSSGASSRSPGSEIEPAEPFTTAASLSLSLSPQITGDESEQSVMIVKPQPCVLVVDDNSINLNLMMTFLKKRNLAALDPAENGKIAVDAVKRMHGYDVIFLDMSMPVMDGFEAARTIRSLEKDHADTYRRAMIIALTGLSSPRDECDAMNSGVDLFLTKPVSFKEVSKLLDRWQGKT